MCLQLQVMKYDETVEVDGDISLGYIITDVVMQSETGVVYEDIPQNGNFDVVAEINGIYSDVNDILPAKLLVAMYDKTGAFVGVKSEIVTEQMIMDGQIKTHIGETVKSISTLKLFIWDSLNTMKPLSDSTTISQTLE